MLHDAQNEIPLELASGERLLWSGQPKQGIRLCGADVFQIPFSLMWGGFAFFWEYQVLTSGAPLFFVLWGIPFVCVGMYLIFGRFLVDAAARGRTFYGITNERVIIVSGLFARKVKSLDIRNLSEVTLNESSDGSGTITFGHASLLSSFFGTGSWPQPGRHAVPQFQMVADARNVAALIREVQRGAA